MSHFKYILIFFAVVIFVSLNIFANEEKPAAAEGTAKESTTFSGQQDEAWMALQTELTAAKAKMDAQQKIVTDLLASKKNNKGHMGKDQVDQLSQNHKDLQKLIKEYNEKLQAFEIKYPEKGQALGRQYSRKKEQTLDQIEGSLTLDGRIRKINKKIKSQFGVDDHSELLEKKSKKIEMTTPQFNPKDDVTEKIIIVK